MVKVKKLVLWCAVVAAIFLFAGLWNYSSYRASCAAHEAGVLAEMQSRMKSSSAKVDELINSLQKVAVDLAREISDNEALRVNPQARLQQVLDASPDIFGIGLIDEDAVADTQFRQSSAAYVTRWEKKHLASADILPLHQEQFYRVLENGEKVVAGAVVVDLSRQHLQKFLYSMHIGKHGYPFLVAANGLFICHPSETMIQEGKTIASYAEKDKIASLADMRKAVESGKEGCFDLYSENSGQSLWGLLSPVKARDWVLAMMVLKEPVLQASEPQQRQLFFALLFLILAAAGGFLLIGLIPGRELVSRLWLASSFLSFGLVIGICVLWSFNLHYRQYVATGETTLTDASILEQYLDNLSYRMVVGGYSTPVRIPTGVFLQSIDFQTAVNVRVTGYVWQKFNVAEQGEIEEGIVFPDAQEIEVEKAYERTTGNTRTVGWNFRLILREGFDYRTYPFDIESVWLRMWPKDFDKNVVLVPDYESYLVDDPESLPGIDAQLVLPGWKLVQSCFTYLSASYNTNFGIAGYAGVEGFPELRFNVIVRRDFLDPFISIILPLLVVAVLVFILLITCSREEGVKDLFGFSAGGILSGIAALFFVVIFAQIDLRKNLEVERIMYMDFYYFVIYLIFLLVSINSVLFCWSRQIALVHYEDNLIPKILYWPFILGVIFITTAFFFCP